MDMPPEPSVVKTSHENTLFRLLGAAQMTIMSGRRATFDEDRGCGRGGMTLDEPPARPQSDAALR